MNKLPLTKKQIIDLFKKQKKLISSSEIIDLQYSEGRILSQDIKSQINIPPFNNSAVDGYALLKKDLNLKKIFICKRRVAAGDNKKIVVKSGEAVRVFTGAKMPSNSSTVVMQENVRVKGNFITLLKTPQFGENYRIKGEDIKKNKMILPIGTKINHQKPTYPLKKMKISKIEKRKISKHEKLKISKREKLKISNFYRINYLIWTTCW